MKIQDASQREKLYALYVFHETPEKAASCGYEPKGDYLIMPSGATTRIVITGSDAYDGLRRRGWSDVRCATELAKLSP
ncbi:MAG TPA: hypothetical protein VIK52_01205 [Opitutaceae bacterium]